MLLQHQQLIEAAKRLRIEVFLSENPLGLRLKYQDLERSILNGESYDSTSKASEAIMDDKQTTKDLLGELTMPTPKGIQWGQNEDETIISEYLNKHQEIHYWVCKPRIGTEGIGVGIHLRNQEEILKHIQKHHELCEYWIIEEQITGEDLRIQVVGGRIVAACRREPAHVIGNGTSTLSDLISKRQKELKTINPDNHLIIDDESKELIHEQGLELESVPHPNHQVQLKRVANMGQGGHAVDLSDNLHHRYEEWIEKIAEKLNIEIFALDAITTDPSEDPLEHTSVLELNARPVWLHHTFSLNKQHDIATMIVKSLFEIN